MQKAILVTGGAGYIGSHLVNKLLENNIKKKIVVIDNLSSGCTQNLNTDNDLIFFKSCISNTKVLGKIFNNFDINDVYHFASSIDASESDKLTNYYCENNLFRAIIFLNFIKEYKLKNLILSSSAAVYGNTNPNRKILETTIKAPINIYGSNKNILENFVQDHSNIFNYKYTFLRYFNVVGSNNLFKRLTKNNSLFDQNVKVIIEQRPYFKVFGSKYNTKDGTAIRDYIHVNDIIDIHIKAMTFLTKTNKSQIFNCGYGKGYSVLEICNNFNKVFKINKKIKKFKSRSGDPECVVADVSKLKKILNWKAKYNNLDNMILSHMSLYK